MLPFGDVLADQNSSRVQVARQEQVSIVLHGQSEFEASHVVLIGSHTFEVPFSPPLQT